MFYFGLDLGQTSDPSACIILEAHGEGDERTYDCRHIEQYTLGHQLPAISCGPCERPVHREPLWGQCTLVIDHTSVGRPVFDMFTEAKLRRSASLSPGGLAGTGKPSANGTSRRFNWWARCSAFSNRDACASGRSCRMRAPYKKSSETSG